MGSYVVEEKLDQISYNLRLEEGIRMVRAHTNRLRKVERDLEKSGEPIDSVFPNILRTLSKIIDCKTMSSTDSTTKES